MTDAPRQDQEQLAEGTLMSHLMELRSRLFKVFIAVIVVFVCLLPFARNLFDIVAKPLVAVVPGGSLIALGPVSPLTAVISLVFYLALFITMPVILYQAWAFVAPGLYRREKKFALPMLASSIVLFYLGMLFAYFVVFPLIFGFTAAFTPELAEYKPDMAEYVSFVMMVVLVFGFAFETPIATVLIVWTGLTTTQSLIKARPYVFLGAFVIGMLLTPPDVISQTILAIPIYVLFELGILMSRLYTVRSKEQGEETVEAES